MSPPGGPLLDDRGRLREPGWAPRPVWQYDPRAAGRRLRRKEWDFYGVTTRDHYVAIVVAHAGYLGVAAVQWIDLAAGRQIVERASVTPFGAGVALPAASERGDVRYGNRSITVELAHRGGGREIRIDWPHRRGRLTVELALAPAHGVAVAVPLGGGAGFYYNHKVPAIPARGSIACGDTRVAIDDGFATLDWGRGVWPYRTSWRWAAAQGRLADGRKVGLTLGDVGADAGAPREDALLVDDVMTKLGPVRIDFDRRDPMRPWRITSDQVDLTLAPRFDNGRALQLGVARTRLRQGLGTVRGTVVTGSGERLVLDALPGWAEELDARW